MKNLATILFLALCLPAASQHVSPLGRFSVAYNQGCSPLTVTVTASGEAASVQGIQYSYEEDVVETTETSYTYSTAGTYRIIQYLGESFSPQTDTIFLTTYEALEPVFNVFYCSETEFVLDMDDDYYDYFYVKTISNDSIRVMPHDAVTLGFPSGSGTLSVKGYFEDAFSNCGVVSRSFSLSTIEETYPEEMAVTNGCSDDYYIQVEASDLNPYYLYQLQYSVDNSPYSDVYTGQLLNKTAQYPINGNDFENNEQICIRFNSLNPCDSTILFSTDRCQSIVSFYSLQNAYASYMGEEVLIQSDSINGLLNLYKTNNDSYSFSQEFTSTTIDTPLSRFRRTNYKIVALDSCGNVIDSTFVSPPFLQLLSKNYNDNILTLDIEDPINNLTLLADSVLMYNLDSTITNTLPLSSQIRVPATIGDFVRLRLKYSYEDNLEIYSNAVETEVIVKVYVPTAFTPNNDGLNDELELFGLPTNNFTFQVYDRWGKVIHQTSENPVWDAKIGKRKVVEGKYLYRLTFELESGEVKTQVGTFAVLKN